MKEEKTHKDCPDCTKNLPLEDFHKRTDGKAGRRPYCKTCDKIRYNTWYKLKHPPKEKNNDPLLKKKTLWKRIYNLTIEDYSKMKENQENRCAICKTDKPMGKGGLHIDHCHKTNKVRGLLCTKCNHGLGNFNDNTKFLEEAIKYLKNGVSEGI